MEEAHPQTPEEAITEQPPTRLVIPGLLFPDAAAFLRAHSCTIKVNEGKGDGIATYTAVTLPVGTQREQIARIATVRYRITFPDSTIIYESYNPGNKASLLYIPAQEGNDTGAATTKHSHDVYGLKEG